MNWEEEEEEGGRCRDGDGKDIGGVEEEEEEEEYCWWCGNAGVGGYSDDDGGTPLPLDRTAQGEVWTWGGGGGGDVQMDGERIRAQQRMRRTADSVSNGGLKAASSNGR
ncbi:hypothetical protein HDU67_009802 [Dinochytrium kinnereticum]|nr:hypothetical protein HDU67_009802 [Dinochytrium kinnereticum]